MITLTENAEHGGLVPGKFLTEADLQMLPEPVDGDSSTGSEPQPPTKAARKTVLLDTATGKPVVPIRYPVCQRLVRASPARVCDGVFGAGMGGTALSAFFTPRLVRSIGYVPTHLLIAGALVIVGILLWLLMRDSPAWKPNLAPVVPKLAAAAKLPLTWQMSFLYAVALMALFLGLGTVGVFAWVAELAPAERVGTITGIVGACGGLGGFFPPLVLGATYNEAEHSYTIGLVLLTITAGAGCCSRCSGCGERPLRLRSGLVRPSTSSGRISRGLRRILIGSADILNVALFTRTWHDL